MSAIKKILIIRFSSIGDIVLCTPVIRCLHNLNDQQIEIHFLTKKKFANLLVNNPHVNKVWALEGKLQDLIPELRKQQFDQIIDLHNNLRSHIVRFHLQRPSRSFNKLNIRKWLLTRFKINRMPEVHIVDRYLETIHKLGGQNDGQGLDFFIFEKDEVSLSKLPEKFRHGYIGFVIGGTYATKRLPAQKIISLCRMLQLPVILLGGPEDKETGEWIAAEAGDNTMNACGLYSLHQSASLVKQARAIISHDTGLMHIAAAFNKPIASVWGNTVPEFGMYPYLPADNHNNPSRIFEVKDLTCRPCSKIGYKKCPLDHFKCMNDIDVQEIAQWANSLSQ